MSFELSQSTLDRFLARATEIYAAQPCLAFVGEEPITYREFGHRAEKLKEDLSKLALEKGDKVVILGNSSPNWAIAFMSVITYGAIAVPVMEDFPEADIDHIIRHSEAKAIFITETLYQGLNLPALDKIQTIFNLDDFSFLLQDSNHQYFWARFQIIPARIKKAFKKTSAAPVKQQSIEIKEDDLAEILYTSGTTGHSKGVMLTHKNLVSNLLAGAEATKVVNENSKVLSVLPMAHSFGSTCAFLSTLSCGASLYLLGKKPSPKILLNAMQMVKPTVLVAVPLIFEKIYHKRVLPAFTQNKMLQVFSKRRFIKKKLFRLIGKKIMKMLGGRLECAVIGGSSLNHEAEMFLREGGIPYVCGYGLTECAPLVSGSSPQEGKIGSVGRAVSGVSIRIADPDPLTGVGEILVKGPNVMKGYYKNEQETGKVFTEDGWLITGDRGYLDEDDYLHIKGRSKNVIVGASGENIYPEVIEDKLKESSFVEEALVYETDHHLIARIYPDYTYIQNLETGKQESVIAANIRKILEAVKNEVNSNLSPASRVHQIIEQTEPFKKTPTQKIKRAEYITN